MSDFKIYEIYVKEMEYDELESGVIIACSEKRAWEIFLNDMKDAEDKEFYLKENWKIKELPLKEYSSYCLRYG